MTKPAKKKEISAKQQQQLAELILRGASYERLSVELGWTLHELFTYRKNNPEFDKLLEESRAWSAQVMEDGLMGMALEHELTYSHKVKSDIYSRIMIARDPGRYNPKVEINLNQTVDIDQAMLDATKRSRDVTNSIPAILTIAKKVPGSDFSEE